MLIVFWASRVCIHDIEKLRANTKSKQAGLAYHMDVQSIFTFKHQESRTNMQSELGLDILAI